MSTSIQAQTQKTTFSRTTSVACEIAAPAGVVWQLLTNLEQLSSWNSTIVSASGRVAVGETVQLVSTLDPNRTFNLTVKSVTPEKQFSWGDRQGERTYTLTPTATGVRFEMRERIGGALFPLFSRFIPDFDDAFAQFATDLRNTAEGNLS